jgi:UDP-galactopyranose mutase
MLTHKNIEYHVNVDYFEVAEKYSDYEKLYFTGPIDVFFEKSGL